MINTISFILNSRIGKSKYLTIDELISSAFDESFIPSKYASKKNKC